MDLSKFTELKNKVKQAELDNATALGKKQAIQQNWKQTYGFDTVEQAQAKLQEIQKQNKDKAEKQQKLLQQLQEILNC